MPVCGEVWHLVAPVLSGNSTPARHSRRHELPRASSDQQSVRCEERLPPMAEEKSEKKAIAPRPKNPVISFIRGALFIGICVLFCLLVLAAVGSMVQTAFIKFEHKGQAADQTQLDESKGK